MSTQVLHHTPIDTRQDDNMEKSDIQKFYTGQTIFITGGTGFLGKLLIEKLLRACYDLRKIYILVRVKKGKSENERFNEIFDKVCFSILKNKYPNFLEKVELVNGDLTKPDIGLTPESQKMLLEEVTTIFHVAATVRFDQHLRTAAYINVRAIQDLLKMAKNMPQLRGFLHVSTAYSHCPRKEILEKFYEPPIMPQNLLNLVNSLDDETITKITPILLKDYPNGYVFTKAVAETVVEEDGKGLPIAMIRPAIVTASVEEPIQGWIDNIYGVNGVVAGAGLGILRTMPADPNTYAELVPVDYVINNILAATWNIEKQKIQDDLNGPIPIYNLVLTPWEKTSWKVLFRYCYDFGMQYPTMKAIWYFCFDVRPNPVMHEIALFFLHTIPAYIMDFGLICFGKKTMAVEGYKKARKFLDVIAYFAQRNWEFGVDNSIKLISVMSPQDRELFNFDLRKTTLKSFIERAILGGRKYLLDDPMETLPAARKRYFKLKIAHYTLCAVLLFFLFKIVMFMFSLIF